MLLSQPCPLGDAQLVMPKDPSAPTAPRQRFRAGRLVLGLGPHGVQQLHQAPPLRAQIPPQPRDRPRLAITANVGGGVASGDHLRSDVSITGGRWIITPQAAERVYRAPEADATAAHLQTCLHVADGATAEMPPQPLILFRNARLRRENRLELATGARVIWADITVLGRQGHAEPWTQGRFEDCLTIRRDGRLIFLDKLLLDPETAPAGFVSSGGLGHATALATLVAQMPDPEALRDHLRERCCPPPSVDMAVGQHRGLVIARLLSAKPNALFAALVDLWRRLRQEGLHCHQALPSVWAGPPEPIPHQPLRRPPVTLPEDLP